VNILKWNVAKNKANHPNNNHQKTKNSLRKSHLITHKFYNRNLKIFESFFLLLYKKLDKKIQNKI